MMTDISLRLSEIDWPQLALHWGLRLVIALILISLGFWLAKAISRGLARTLERGGADAILSSFLCNVSYAIILIVVLIMALGTVGVQTTSLLAMLGAAGLTIGLALKDSLANIASGVLLILSRPFRSGDSVKIAAIEGVIEQVHIFHTVLRTPQNDEVTVPNSQITHQAIVNFSAKGMRRIDIPFGVAYKENIALARDTLLALANANSKVLSNQATEVLVTNFSESGVTMVLRAWVKPEDYGDVISELIETAHQEFMRIELKLAREIK